MTKKISDIPYFEIFKNAWIIVWKNRFLWWFGFFVALSSFSGISFPFESSPENIQNETDQKIADFISQNLNLVIFSSIVIFIILIIFLILGIVARGALISSIWKKAKGESADFKSGIQEGKNNFWKVFSISLILTLLIFLIVIVLVAPVAVLFINKNYLIGLLMGISAFLIFIPIIILMSFIKKYALIYSILAKMSFWNSLESAYNLFRKNILSSIIMGLFFLPISLIIGFAVMMIVIALSLIFVAIGFGLYFLAGKIGAIIVAGVGVIIFLLLMFLIQSAYQAFSQAVWVLFFRDIASSKENEPVVEPIAESESISKPMPMIEIKK